MLLVKNKPRSRSPCRFPSVLGCHCKQPQCTYPYTVDDAHAFLRPLIDTDPHSVYAFAILADGRLAGSISAYRKENMHFRTADLGYYVGEPYWG